MHVETIDRRLNWLPNNLLKMVVGTPVLNITSLTNLNVKIEISTLVSIILGLNVTDRSLLHRIASRGKIISIRIGWNFSKRRLDINEVLWNNFQNSLLPFASFVSFSRNIEWFLLYHFWRGKILFDLLLDIPELSLSKRLTNFFMVFVKTRAQHAQQKRLFLMTTPHFSVIK